MKQGDIILIPLPQADGKIKPRPVLLLSQMPGFGDWLVCGISKQLQQQVNNFDLLIDITQPLYKNSGLLQTSIARLSFLSTIPSNQIRGRIGFIDSSSLTYLLKNLSAHLVKSGLRK